MLLTLRSCRGMTTARSRLAIWRTRFINAAEYRQRFGRDLGAADVPVRSKTHPLIPAGKTQERVVGLLILCYLAASVSHRSPDPTSESIANLSDFSFLQRYDNGEINFGDLANASLMRRQCRQRFGP
jgi:hypothetical protein